jgi:hypothetical protein
MCRLTEQVVFTDPYHASLHNRHTSPQLDSEAAALRADVPARCAAAALKAKFVGQAQALLHGDLHTGSIMATGGCRPMMPPAALGGAAVCLPLREFCPPVGAAQAQPAPHLRLLPAAVCHPSRSQLPSPPRPPTLQRRAPG